jgi:hypothetical protein
MLDANGNLIDLDFELISLQTKSMLESGLQVVAFAKKQILTEKTAIDPADIESEFVFLGLQGVERFNPVSKQIHAYMYLIKNTLFGEDILQANDEKTVESFNRQISLTGKWNENNWQVAEAQLQLDWIYLLALVFIGLLLIVFLGSLFYLLYFLVANNFVLLTAIAVSFLLIIFNLLGLVSKNSNERQNLVNSRVQSRMF